LVSLTKFRRPYLNFSGSPALSEAEGSLVYAPWRTRPALRGATSSLLPTSAFFSSTCALFHFPYTTFFPPSSFLSISSALFPKTRGCVPTLPKTELPMAPQFS